MAKLRLVCLFLLLLTSCSQRARGQWAQTIGWGGAGMGKRGVLTPSNAVLHLLRPSPMTHAAGRPTSLEPSLDSDPTSPRCFVDPEAFKEIARIIQAELSRVHLCIASEMEATRN